MTITGTLMKAIKERIFKILKINIKTVKEIFQEFDFVQL
jgi:hypothetical protein